MTYRESHLDEKLQRQKGLRLWTRVEFPIRYRYI